MKMDLFDSPPRHEQKSTARGEGRSLPFSEDGEKGVLCSLLLSPRDVLDLCQIKLRPEAFYAPAHQILFNLVAELVNSNKPIDFITLKQALKDRAQLDEIGGPEYLSDLFSFVSSAANAGLLHRYHPREVPPSSDDHDLQPGGERLLRSPRGGGRSVGPR
jgi:replicative DNA helicase